MSDVRLMRFFQLSVATAIEKHLDWMRGLLDEREREITSLRAEVERLKSREITDKKIDAAWEYAKDQKKQRTEKSKTFSRGMLHGLNAIGIVACPKCGGTNRYIDPYLNYQECECPSCSNNGWIREESGDE